MAPAAAPTPVPIRAPLPAPYPVPAPTAAPAPAPTTAPVAVPHAVSPSSEHPRRTTLIACLIACTSFRVLVPGRLTRSRAPVFPGRDGQCKGPASDGRGAPGRRAIAHSALTVHGMPSAGTPPPP